VHFTSEAIFERETDDAANHTRVTAYFYSKPQTVTIGQSLNLDAVVSEMNNLVEQFTCRGSGLVLSSVTKLTVIMVRFRPLGGGSSYIQTPSWLYRKHAVINVKCYHSQDCFRWAILSSLYPVKMNSDRVSSYAAHKNDIDCSDLTFPVKPYQIPIFERNNLSIGVHCLAYDKTSKSFSILYLSPEIHKRAHKVTLLLLDSPDGGRHYVWVKSLSRLIASNYTLGHRRYVCLSCLQTFTSQRVLEEHEMHCLSHAPQQCVYPAEEKTLMRFNAHHCEFPMDFYLCANFECFLQPPPPDIQDDTVVSTHFPSGFCVYRITDHDEFRTPPFTYPGAGQTVMESFSITCSAKQKSLATFCRATCQ